MDKKIKSNVLIYIIVVLTLIIVLLICGGIVLYKRLMNNNSIIIDNQDENFYNYINNKQEGINTEQYDGSINKQITLNGENLYIELNYTNKDIIEENEGSNLYSQEYDLVVNDTHIENVDLSPDAKELRFVGTYRHNFGPWTDGAIGFIYRVNPNNTSEFGNESIFMMKLNHRLGI